MQPFIKKRRRSGTRLLSLALGICLSIAMLGSLGTISAAADTPTVQASVGSAASAALTARSRPADAIPTPVLLDGVEILSGEAFRTGGVTYVPLRSFCEAFDDPKISWSGATNTATVKTKTLTLYATAGSYYIQANDRYLYTVGEILNVDGRLYVPVRPMALAFAAELGWNASAAQVELRRTSASAISPASYKADEVYWLSRIISAEAGGEPFLGQMAVGNVVLNRVRHKSYPNTVYGVIFDRKHGTQFSPVAIGTVYNPPTQSAVIAAKICLEGYTLSDSALFFMNPRIATSNWISKNRPFAFTIGNHDFYD